MGNFRYNSNNYYNNNGNNNSSWKKAKEDNFNGDSKLRSYSRKPSFGGRRLSLEEQFCASLGGLSWQEVLESQKYMYQHEKILQWKDSAAEDAFWNAKKRFFAMIKRQPCDIQLPDPDVFIDNIDWNASIDPQLMSDLENKESDVSCKKQDGDVVVEIPPVLDSSGLTADGWGDSADVKPQLNDCERHDLCGNEQWADTCEYKEEKGCSNGWEDNNVYSTHNMERHGVYRDNGSAWNGYSKQSDHNNRKQWNYSHHGNRGHGGWNTSRYKISRFQQSSNDPLVDNHGSRKGNFSYQRPPLAQWKPVARQC